MANLKNIVCKECCIVIDHGSHFLELSGSKLELESNAKTSQYYFTNLQKSTWTCVVEGIVEYCRIIYDLFPPSYKVAVLCSDETVTNISTFQDDHQNTNQLLKGFGDLGPPLQEYEGTVSVFPGVEQGAEALLSKTKDNANTIKRMIVVTTIHDERDSKSISNVVWEMQNHLEKSKVFDIDLLVVNISKDNKVSHPRLRVSPHLEVTTITLKPNQCSEKLALLTRRHYNLQSTIVTGIPMKEEQHSGMSSIYSVEMIHLAAAHHNVDYPDLKSAPLLPKKSSRSSVTLKWCTPKTNSSHELQTCVGTFLVTPTEVNSRPAACLTMFLLQGRTVMLEGQKKSGGKVMTHMLSSHGGELFIHVLAYGRSPLEDPPSITEGIGGRVTDYRINDFGRMMKETRLAPYENINDDPNQLGINCLERYSKHWPMVISDTLIFNMQANLNPLLTLLLKPVLQEKDVQECTKVIYKLQAMESRNDTLPLPIVTLKGKASKKEEQYKSLWSELETFIQGAASTSPMHEKVLLCLRGTHEFTDSKNSEDKINSEAKSWNESDRYQNMNVRENSDLKRLKGELNEGSRKSVGAPSDPRKRRRTSESSSKPVDTTPHGKVLPEFSTLEEPPSKVKKTDWVTTDRFTNNSTVIQEQSSILSIWMEHKKSAASQLHEEFVGRKEALNGRYELYRKEIVDGSEQG